MPFQNIDEVINALNVIVANCEQNKLRAGYFAALYKRMTVAVKEGIQKGMFEDGSRMEKLDICFAERYTSAWQCYGQKQPCSASWQFAFDGCYNNNNTVIQNLLLGVNTHINLDLAIAAATIAPGDSINALEADFNRINDAIASLVDDIQESLAQVWFPMRMLSKIVNNKQEAVLNFSIDTARKTAWANALLLAYMDDAQKQVHIREMDNLVKQIAQGIQSPGGWAGFVLKLVRKTEYDDTARTIRLIDTTVVE